jgi:hypothetical protein
LLFSSYLNHPSTRLKPSLAYSQLTFPPMVLRPVVQVANWGLPIAALADIQKDETMISGVMSPTMAGYS